MVKYKVKEMKEGCEGERYDGNTSKRFWPDRRTVLTGIVCDPEDTVIKVPECFEGFAIPLGCVGYVERYTPAHEDWSDWQHGKGDKYPARYELIGMALSIPAWVERVELPDSVRSISDETLRTAGDKLRVSQSNPHFRVVDGRLVPVK